ncbi:MAG: deoxyribose-phosphate aldolase [Tenacibaculum sp.]
MEINQYIDHTLLKANARQNDIVNLCNQAVQYSFYAVCVNASYVSLAKKQLKESSVQIATVVGFPLGAMTAEAKLFEAEQALVNGATEIDMVINIGNLLDSKYKEVENEICQLKTVVKNCILKVIFENCYLSKEHIEIATQLAINAGADFIKTSTGFGTAGVAFDDIVLMKKAAKNKIRIKAAGGIDSLETAQRYIRLGVDRLGTSSGVKLVTDKVTPKNSY